MGSYSRSEWGLRLLEPPVSFQDISFRVWKSYLWGFFQLNSNLLTQLWFLWTIAWHGHFQETQVLRAQQQKAPKAPPTCPRCRVPWQPRTCPRCRALSQLQLSTSRTHSWRKSALSVPQLPSTVHISRYLSLYIFLVHLYIFLVHIILFDGTDIRWQI